MTSDPRPLPDRDYVRWTRLRRRGRAVFVCWRGLVLWGFGSGLVAFALVGFFLATVGQASSSRLMLLAIWSLATFGIGGLVWMWIVWTSTEQLYRISGTSRCTSCGYELHGNETGVCPECGEAHSAHGAR